MDSMQNNAEEMAAYPVEVELFLNTPCVTGVVYRPKGTDPKDIALTEDEKDWFFSGNCVGDVELKSARVPEG